MTLQHQILFAKKIPYFQLKDEQNMNWEADSRNYSIWEKHHGTTRK